MRDTPRNTGAISGAAFWLSGIFQPGHTGGRGPGVYRTYHNQTNKPRTVRYVADIPWRDIPDPRFGNALDCFGPRPVFEPVRIRDRVRLGRGRRVYLYRAAIPNAHPRRVRPSRVSAAVALRANASESGQSAHSRATEQSSFDRARRHGCDRVRKFRSRLWWRDYVLHPAK